MAEHEQTELAISPLFIFTYTQPGLSQKANQRPYTCILTCLGCSDVVKLFIFCRSSANLSTSGAHSLQTEIQHAIKPNLQSTYFVQYHPLLSFSPLQ